MFNYKCFPYWGPSFISYETAIVVDANIITIRRLQASRCPGLNENIAWQLYCGPCCILTTIEFVIPVSVNEFKYSILRFTREFDAKAPAIQVIGRGDRIDPQFFQIGQQLRLGRIQLLAINYVETEAAETDEDTDDADDDEHLDQSESRLILQSMRCHTISITAGPSIAQSVLMF